MHTSGYRRQFFPAFSNHSGNRSDQCQIHESHTQKKAGEKLTTQARLANCFSFALLPDNRCSFGIGRCESNVSSHGRYLILLKLANFGYVVHCRTANLPDMRITKKRRNSAIEEEDQAGPPAIATRQSTSESLGTFVTDSELSELVRLAASRDLSMAAICHQLIGEALR